MKTRLNVFVIALLVIVGALLWTIGKVRRVAAAATPAASLPVTIRVETMAAATPVAPSPPVDPAHGALPPAAPVQPTTPIAETPAPAAPASDPSRYVAKPGDTVSDIAAALPGGDVKSNRDAVIDANPSLQRNPDRVLAGKTYTVPVAGSTPEVVPVVDAQPAVAAVPQTDQTHELKYNARPGDTVSTLASALLGSNTRENRDAIIDANASLQNDPDKMEAQKTYRIPVRAGQPLAAADASETPMALRPATQPDADSIVQNGSGRELRYTAQSGDTVASLAVALLGSDTKLNRAAIINSNASLRLNPDRVVAGQMYWIAAPTASQSN